MATAPSLTPPREGELIDRGESAYVKRQSAETQARFWNEVLADDPVFGPESGFRVGVGPRMDRRYPLVWVRTWCPEHGHGCEAQNCPCGHTIGCDCWSIANEH